MPRRVEKRQSRGCAWRVKDLLPLGGKAAPRSEPGSIRSRDSQSCFARHVAKNYQAALHQRCQQIRGAGVQTTLTYSRTALINSCRDRPVSRSPTTSGYWLPVPPFPALAKLILPENEPGFLDHAGQGQSDAMRGPWTMVCCEVFGQSHGHHRRGQPRGHFELKRLQAATGILYDAFHSIARGMSPRLVHRALRGGHTRRRKGRIRGLDGAFADAGDRAPRQRLATTTAAKGPPNPRNARGNNIERRGCAAWACIGSGVSTVWCRPDKMTRPG